MGCEGWEYAGRRLRSGRCNGAACSRVVLQGERELQRLLLAALHGAEYMCAPQRYGAFQERPRVAQRGTRTLPWLDDFAFFMPWIILPGMDPI